MTRKILTLAIIAAASSVLAMPMQPTQILTPVANDGYLIVAQARPDGPNMLVCPPGKEWLGIDGRKTNPTCSDDDGGVSAKGSSVPSVLPQTALDLSYGKGVAAIVGMAPRQSGFKSQTVIFYRILGKTTT